MQDIWRTANLHGETAALEHFQHSGIVGKDFRDQLSHPSGAGNSNEMAHQHGRDSEALVGVVAHVLDGSQQAGTVFRLERANRHCATVAQGRDLGVTGGVRSGGGDFAARVSRSGAWARPDSGFHSV